MLLETVRNDPDYKNGDYSAQPRSMKYANALFGVATAGGTLNYQKQAPTAPGRQDRGRPPCRSRKWLGRQ